MIKTDTRNYISDNSTGKLIGKIVTTNDFTNSAIGDFSLKSSDFYKETSEITYKAEKVINRVTNKSILEQGKKIIYSIQENLITIQQLGLSTNYLPPINASILEDGSLLIEWAFNDFSLGIGVESDPKKSSWYLVSSKNFNECIFR